MTLAVLAVFPAKATDSRIAAATSFVSPGGSAEVVVGVQLVGRFAPRAAAGEKIRTADNAADVSAEVESVIPLLSEPKHASRRAFAFTDASGAPVAPPHSAVARGMS